MNHRVSNLLKIKNELTVDSYLRHDDPRIMSEGWLSLTSEPLTHSKCWSADLTDKFDFTFICGDLNFRLDITRLHADWLITQKGIFLSRRESQNADRSWSNRLRTSSALRPAKEAHERREGICRV